MLLLYILTVAQNRTEVLSVLPASNPTSVQGEIVNIGGNQTFITGDNVGGNLTKIEKQVVFNVGERTDSRGMWKKYEILLAIKFAFLFTYVLGLGLYGYLCTRVGYVISGRVPGYPQHLGLRRNRSFLRPKQDGNKICRETLASESKICQNHKFTHTEINFFLRFVDYLCLFIII